VKGAAWGKPLNFLGRASARRTHNTRFERSPGNEGWDGRRLSMNPTTVMQKYQRGHTYSRLFDPTSSHQRRLLNSVPKQRTVEVHSHLFPLSPIRLLGLGWCSCWCFPGVRLSPSVRRCGKILRTNASFFQVIYFQPKYPLHVCNHPSCPLTYSVGQAVTF